MNQVSPPAPPAPEQGAQAALPEHVPLEGSQAPSGIATRPLAYDDLCPPDPLNDPSMPYRTTIQHANTPQEATRAYNAAPEELRQDLWGCYQDAMKGFGKKKA